MKGIWKKADLVLLALLAVLLTGAQWYVLRSYGTETEPRSVVVTVDNQEIARYELTGPEREIHSIETAYGINVLVLEDGQAWIEEADCGDKTCVHMGTIERAGQLLVCAPHHMIVSVEGGEETGTQKIDGMTR